MSPTAAQPKDFVKRQIENRGVSDARVLDAMRKLPRELFVPADLRDRAYADRPLPIGSGQTISPRRLSFVEPAAWDEEAERWLLGCAWRHAQRERAGRMAQQGGTLALYQSSAESGSGFRTA